jgi:dienelactone hydrolase
MERARMIARLGYVALAADMFGERRQASDLQEARALLAPLRDDPQKLRARGRAAMATLAALPQVDAGRLGAVGFCFGGTVVLELARDGADLKAPDQVMAFEAEMRAAGVQDWQVISYGGTLHGFTNPAADGSILPSARYNERSDRRSWQAMQSFLAEAFA